MKKRNVANRAAASRKAWRTRKRMALARKELRPAQVEMLIGVINGDHEPAYMRRALPRPDFGSKR